MRATIPFIAAALLFTASCGNDSSSTGSDTADSSARAGNAGIILADVPSSPGFPDAQLGISGMQATPAGKDSVKLAISFSVKNYDLKAQTADAAGKQCNNSDKGQHIHFILDNKPYVALYEPKHEVTVPVNTEHYLLCFLSRSYHESVKERPAGVLAHFKINEKGAIQKLDSPATPMLFYSRPKGDYLGKDTANILLDFYPVNMEIGKGKYIIEATVTNQTTGENKMFLIDNWKPYFIQGLGTGKASVELQIRDANNNDVVGPNTSVRRDFNLAASEPMK